MVLVANQKKNLNFVPKKGVSIVLFKKKKLDSNKFPPYPTFVYCTSLKSLVSKDHTIPKQPWPMSTGLFFPLHNELFILFQRFI